MQVKFVTLFINVSFAQYFGIWGFEGNETKNHWVTPQYTVSISFLLHAQFYCEKFDPKDFIDGLTDTKIYMQYMYVVSHPWGASFPILFYTYQYPGMCYFNLPSYCCLLTRIVHAKKNNWQRLISSFRWAQSNALLLVQHFLEALFRMIPNCFYSFFFCELKEEHFSLLRFFFSSVSLSFFFENVILTWV